VVQARNRLTKEEHGQAIDQLVTRLNNWSIPDDAVDRVHDAARASLNEVKALTEYEDGKVSRLLTIIAFLSAVVGAVFTRFAADYAWPAISRFSWSADWFLPTATYLSFFSYILLVTWSVLKVLGGVRPKFNVPATWIGASKAGLPPSMTFYRGILDVSAPQWGEAFEQLTGANALDLKRYYAKCYVTEAYLVAEKVADKLAVVDPGVKILQWAMGDLFLFFGMFSLTIVTVGPTHHI
jgi:hypothetical protein